MSFIGIIEPAKPKTITRWLLTFTALGKFAAIVERFLVVNNVPATLALVTVNTLRNHPLATSPCPPQGDAKPFHVLFDHPHEPEHTGRGTPAVRTISYGGIAMTRLLLIAFAIFILTTSLAQAEWTEVGSAGSGTDDFIFYVDVATIQRTGHLAKVWGLFDFTTVQTSDRGISYLSRKAQWEYDCQKEKSRILVLNRYSGHMGNGNILDSVTDPSKWIPVISESVDGAIWKSACGKK